MEGEKELGVTVEGGEAKDGGFTVFESGGETVHCFCAG